MTPNLTPTTPNAREFHVTQEDTNMEQEDRFMPVIYKNAPYYGVDGQ
ncbi:hypothetical protein KSB_52120 [Ktedonobacter robiniae]|uniref:Uncharacterized protein n=1 Tax=Ktedonobacter robiniae TaxID=2778365 RepID=A0ABQ3UVL4_9CHLR|nr:hypothetical protein KSB_52120 [Ktedonobacter robiniae]